MYYLNRLTKENLLNFAVKLRNMDTDAASMEAMAVSMVSYIYENFVLSDGSPACSLVRFFKTHPYDGLPEDIQLETKSILNGRTINRDTKCLTLLATMGENPQWNSRKLSVGHQVLPLIDQDTVAKIPMISQLIWQFGLEIENVIKPEPQIIINLGRKNFNVFYIPEAIDSPYIPAQTQFVIPYQIKSVLGLGGMLPSGNIFVIILFSKVQIPVDLAYLFKWVAVYARVAATSVEKKGIIFDNKPIDITNISKNSSNKHIHQVINFQGANLQGVNFQGANLIGANFQGANLIGAIMPDGSIYTGS
ncbi:MAG: pentapeptide repeat-containing protein [Nostochopsis sp.]